MAAMPLLGRNPTRPIPSKVSACLSIMGAAAGAWPPLAPPQAMRPQHAKSARRGQRHRDNARALIVDDSSAMRTIVERSLRRAGFSIAEVFGQRRRSAHHPIPARLVLLHRLFAQSSADASSLELGRSCRFQTESLGMIFSVISRSFSCPGKFGETDCLNLQELSNT